MEPAVAESTIIHPLLIKHVLERVFSNIFPSGKDLLSCRIVCKEWHSVATKLYRETPNAKLSTPPPVRVGFVTIVYDGKEFEPFMEAMRGSWLIPITKVELHGNFFHEKNLSLFLEFLRNFGKFLKEIKVYVFGFDMINQEFPFMGLTHQNLDTVEFTQLKTLSFSYCCKEDRGIEYNQSLGCLLFCLFKKSPSLEELNFTLWNEQEELTNSIFLGHIPLMSLRNLPTLKKINIAVDLHEQRLEEVEYNFGNLQLENLVMVEDSEEYPCLLRDWLANKQKQELIASIWRSQCNSLKGLEMNVLIEGMLGDTTFQKLEKLETEYYHHQGYPLFGFLSSFPALKELKLSTYYRGYNMDDPTNNQGPLIVPEVTTMERLDYKITVHGYDKLNMRKITSPFPCLKIVNLEITIMMSVSEDFRFLKPTGGWETLHDVFSYLPNTLEELAICIQSEGDEPEEIGDSLLTGLPPELCKDILENKDFDREIEEGVQKGPGLRNFPNLRIFLWQSCEIPITVTDVTIHMVITKMAKLKECTVWGLKPSKESRKLLGWDDEENIQQPETLDICSWLEKMAPDLT